MIYAGLSDPPEGACAMYETYEGVTLVNLTPHEIVLRTPRGEVYIPPSGRVIRAREETALVDTVAQLPVWRKNLSGIQGDVPPAIPGRRYIVSSIAAQALPEREDFLIPSPIRDESGRVIATKGFFIVGQERDKDKDKETTDDNV